MTARPASGPIITVRDVATRDLPIIESIYAHHVLNGLASFEDVPPGLAEIERRHRDITSRGLPYVVAELDGQVAAYAYASPYRARPAYRHTLEDSVYVDRDAVGRGLGRAALAAVIGRVTALGYRQMIAIIGGSGNAASIGLHQALGFQHAGTLRSVGFKFGRWVDSVLMQLSLGAGDSEPPTL